MRLGRHHTACTHAQTVRKAQDRASALGGLSARARRRSELPLATAVALFSIVALIGVGTPRLAAQTLDVIHAFDGNDGASPLAPLVEASDGTLYGTTSYGGPHFGGGVFKLNKDGSGFL